MQIAVSQKVILNSLLKKVASTTQVEKKIDFFNIFNVVSVSVHTKGHYFAQRGYDVFFGNARGNRFSRNHTTIDPNDEQFWRFR